MVLLEELKKAIEIDDNECFAENLIEKISLLKEVDAIPYLIKLINETESCTLRNSIALALADMNEQSALEPILSLKVMGETVLE